ncbi:MULTISPECIES: DUF4232 domain-containing protein [Amycolatopsis]|uniref:DUF4232 domain-containing protein n=1 Tax=Amycolatopsis TaxID=1813 RepID=UPI00055A73E0|nr:MULTISPECIES: DUF4232 domain-containing protein [Amycolatopsis]MCG3749335.1 DUF4232 domain-containing protein [Amycolatopsis sp. Poz14]
MANTKKPWISLVFLSAVGASGALLLSACGQGAPAASGPASSDTPSSSPMSSASSAASSAPSSASSSAPSGGTAPAEKPPADNGLCKAGDVSLSLGGGDAGAGSEYRPLLIKNTSSTPCTIQGFPGVSYVGGENGTQIGQAAERDGTKGAPVKLAPGQTAAADLQFAQVRNFDPGVCKPTPVKGLRVYLPQETASKFVPLDGLGCAGTNIPGKQLGVKTVHKA